MCVCAHVWVVLSQKLTFCSESCYAQGGSVTCSWVCLHSCAQHMSEQEKQAELQSGRAAVNLWPALGVIRRKALLLGGLCGLLWAALPYLFWEQQRLRTQHDTCMTIYFCRGYKYVILSKKVKAFWIYFIFSYQQSFLFLK